MHRNHPRTRRVLGGLVAGVLLAPLAAGTAAADQGVARDVEEACSYASQSDFTDRPADGFGDAVDCVAHYRITTGTTPTTYGPGERVTRGQMASFIVRTGEVAGLFLPEPADDEFGDDDASIHQRAINRLAGSGVASGFSDGTYRPRADVTRGQMARFIANELRLVTGGELPEPTADYFADDDGHTHEKPINELAEIGVVTGTGEGTYSPNNPVTRRQMALFLTRSLDWLTEVKGTPLARIDVTDPTGSPELVSATASTSGSTVTFTFDEAVAPNSIVISGFKVIGFDGEASPATSIVQDSTPDVVKATFPAAKAALATTAVVDRNTVQDADGNLSPEGAAPLQDVELLAGTSSAPDLVSVTNFQPAGTDGTVDFGFDENAHVVNEGGYHLVLDDGTVKSPVAGSAAVGTGTNKHTVTFTGLDTAQAVRIVRGYVEVTTVSDAAQTDAAGVEGNVNPQQAVAVAAGGRTTGRPDLVSITVDAGADKVRYTFDEAIDLAPNTGNIIDPAVEYWQVYDLHGGEVESSVAEKAADDNRSVVVTFAEGTVSTLTSGASVDRGAVTSAASTAADKAAKDNLVDEVGLPRTFAAGETAAPDLIRAGRVQQAAGNPLQPSTARRVVFEFDQRLVLDDATSFSVYAPSGARTALVGCTAAVSSRFVTCTADSGTDPAVYKAIGEAALAGVHGAAVSDVSGEFPSHVASAVL